MCKFKVGDEVEILARAPGSLVNETGKRGEVRTEIAGGAYYQVTGEGLVGLTYHPEQLRLVPQLLAVGSLVRITGPNVNNDRKHIGKLAQLTMVDPRATEPEGDGLPYQVSGELGLWYPASSVELHTESEAAAWLRAECVAATGKAAHEFEIKARRSSYEVHHDGALLTRFDVFVHTRDSAGVRARLGEVMHGTTAPATIPAPAPAPAPELPQPGSHVLITGLSKYGADARGKVLEVVETHNRMAGEFCVSNPDGPITRQIHTLATAKPTPTPAPALKFKVGDHVVITGPGCLGVEKRPEYAAGATAGVEAAAPAPAPKRLVRITSINPTDLEPLLGDAKQGVILCGYELDPKPRKGDAVRIAALHPDSGAGKYGPKANGARGWRVGDVIRVREITGANCDEPGWQSLNGWWCRFELVSEGEATAAGVGQ